MANGDKAAAAGMAVVDPFTDDWRMGYDEINKTRDYLADRTRMAAGTVAPVEVPASGTVSTTVNFPVGKFTVPPVVVATTVGDLRMNMVTILTVTTANFTMKRGSSDTVPRSVGANWVAVQVA